MTNFWLEVSLYRDTAQVTAINFVTGDKFVAPIKLVPRHSYNSERLYHDAKNCAIPSLHRDSFLAKVISTCPGASSGNVFALYCRAVSGQHEYPVQDDRPKKTKIVHLIKFLYNDS